MNHWCAANASWRGCLAILATFSLLWAGSAACADSAAKVAATQVPVETGDYVIGPGDSLRVFVLQNPELSTEVPVRPDGKITTPLVNDMVAVGKTAGTLSKEIELVLAEYVRSPTVSVIVTKSAGAFAQVRVVGQAASPKALPYRAGMTVLDAIIEVGGLSQYAAGNRAQLVRTDGSKVTRIRIKLHDLLNKGEVKHNLPLRAGDVLVIPEARF
jgi:polysaccharide biosynthesis/export protein